jgi:C-terminal processing protease CtpA/Prc
LTPDGVSISGGGLTPNVVVPITADDISAGRDPQMAKAVQIVKK